jgi:hypothetical protein
MTAAVNNLVEQADFQKSYQSLLRHYSLDGRKIQTGQPNETGMWSSATIASGARWTRR